MATILVLLGGAVCGLIIGGIVGSWKTYSAYDNERQAWIASGAELEARAIKSEREATELRADNIRLLDEKLSL